MKKHLSKLMTFSFILLMVIACKKDEATAPSLIGNWKWTSNTRSNCTNAGDNGVETCTSTTPAECGILTLTATTWTYTQTPAGGSPTVDAGTYTVSGSTLTTSGGSGGPGTLTYTVTATTLTFVEVNSSNGCTETTVFTRQ